jgi:uncharacterized metal-binding protein
MTCPGASGAGKISDLTTRKLHDNKVLNINHLAVVGAGIEKSIENFKTKEILIIDGFMCTCCIRSTK